MRSIFSGGAAPMGFAVARLCVDQFPQFVQSFACDCRNGQHRVFKHGFECLSRADPLTARQLVYLRRDKSDRRSRGLEPVAGLDVLVQSRMPRVDQEQGVHPGPRRSRTVRRPAGGAPLEIAPRQLLEFRSARRVSIAREVDHVQRRGSFADSVHVCGPRLAGSGAGPRDARPHQRIDQARFADVRTTDQRNLGEAVAWEIGDLRGARHELGRDRQERFGQTGLAPIFLLMSDGIVADGAGDRLGLRIGG